MQYDQCNEDNIKVMGVKEYCPELYKDQSSFIFWSQNEVGDMCQKVNLAQVPAKVQTDKCAALNEVVFSKYRKVQAEVLTQLKEQAKSEIQKKKEKESKLRMLVEEEAFDADDSSESKQEEQAKKVEPISAPQKQEPAQPEQKT